MIVVLPTIAIVDIVEAAVVVLVAVVVRRHPPPPRTTITTSLESIAMALVALTPKIKTVVTVVPKMTIP
jgi:hypothetical protein